MLLPILARLYQEGLVDYYRYLIFYNEFSL